jgi:hypothetical protein
MIDNAEDHQPELAAITAADWKGWWGADPPYHAPVFVLTHVGREPLEMEGRSG